MSGSGTLLPTASALRRIILWGSTFSATSPTPAFPSVPVNTGSVLGQERDAKKEDYEEYGSYTAGAAKRRRIVDPKGHSNVHSEANVGSVVRIRGTRDGVASPTRPNHSTNSDELDFSALLDESWPQRSRPSSTRPFSSAMSSRRLLQTTSRRRHLRQVHTSSQALQPSLESHSQARRSDDHHPSPSSTPQHLPPLEGHRGRTSHSHDAPRPYSPYPSPSASFTHSNALPSNLPPHVSASPVPAHPAVQDPPPPRPREQPKQSISIPHLDEINTLLRHPTLYDPIRVPRLPIVLCHGLYGFDVRGPAFFRLHYWGELLKILRGKVGSEVIVAGVPGTGAIKQRAHVLNQALEQTPSVLGKDLNFLAHSMGGLDSRYLFSSIHPTAYHPRTLTTLCTPHRGSEFMSWCRANIGIGTDFDATSEAAASALHHEPVELPFSLKAPVLTRAQKEAKDKRDEKERAAKSLLSALPFSISSSLSSYLLDLLDSPAYANLTPSFLQNVFNPSTPDRPDISYYSVAARTPHIGIWHPLWLPKLVLDGASKVRIKQGIECEEKYRGNDGLVNVESAMWGHFLGVVEDCDHWEMRGGSGLEEKVMIAKAAADAVAEKAKGESKGWSWQDVYALVGTKKDNKKANKEEKKEAVEAVVQEDPEKSAKRNGGDGQDQGTLNSVAGWITKRLPGYSSTSDPASRPLTPAEPVSVTPSTSTAAPLSASEKKANDQARLQYGAPASKAKPEKFNLERMTIAVCKKLYDDGF